MRIDVALQYVLDEARKVGYDEREIEVMTPEVKEKLYDLENCDIDEVNELIEEIL